MNKQLLRAQLLIILSLGFISTFGQPGGTQPDANMFTGAGNSFGINSIYNTNLFDGTVNINIPIYQFANDFGDFGVSLSYNTKGVLVDEFENPEGLHFSIEAQPKIERLVRDIPDEINIVGPDSVYKSETVFWNKNKYVRGKLAIYWESPEQQSMTNVYRDGESDDFMVTIGGYSFVFNLGRELTIFTHPKRNVKIQPLLGGTPMYSLTNQIVGSDPDVNTLSFLITDEKGTEYLFERDNIIHKTYYDNSYWDDLAVGSFGITTRWNVRKITFADGRVIKYNYAYSRDWGFGISPATQYINHFVCEKNDGTKEYKGQKSELNESEFSQLASIEYPNGNNVQFIYNDNIPLIYYDTALTTARHKVLTEIRIGSRREQANCFRYKFFQSKLNGRRYLDSIKITSCDNSVQEPFYSFEYNNMKLPARLNTGQDLFGYFNADSVATPIGMSGNKINIPKHNYANPGSGNYGLGKSYLPYYAQAGLLSKIKNAYGGQARFVYKANTNDLASPFVIPGGSGNELFVGVGTLGMDGVAIDSIIEKEKFHPNDSSITVFDYHNSGKLFTPGGYVHYPQLIDSVTGTWKETMFQALYLSPHQFVKGSNHGYSNVGVKKINALGELQSRTEYSFTNISDNLSTSRFFKVNGSKEIYEFPYANKQYIKDWEIGLPLEVSEYDNNNRIVMKTINTYSFSAIDTSLAPYMRNVKKSKVNTGTEVTMPYNVKFYPNKITFTDSYSPFTGTAQLVKSTTQKYVSDTRFVFDEILYEYDSKNNTKAIITQDSKGDKKSTNFIYNYDVDGPASGWSQTNPNTAIYNMSGAGLEYLVGVEHWRINPGTQPASNSLIDASIAQYTYSPGKVWQKGQLELTSSTPLSYPQFTDISSPNPSTNPYGKILLANNTSGPVPYFQRNYEITLFDAEGKPLEKKQINQSKYVSVVWDTATDVKLAEASNCRYNEIGYSSFEDINATDGWQVRGNLDINCSKVIIPSTPVSASISGKYIYALTPPPPTGFNFSDILGKENLTSGKDYMLSFWSYGGAPLVYYGTTLLNTPGAYAYEVNGWKNYIYKFSATTADKIKISPQSSSTIYLDEVRLHPTDALMTSWTYAPFYGVSSETDFTGRIQYLEYDKMGRITVSRDQEGNITKKVKHMIGAGN